jgi:sec-independent protein translocase protein TatA
MGIPAPTELILILAIVVLLFGSKRIPEIMDGIGKGIKTFKKSMESDDTPVPPPVAQPPPPHLAQDAKDHQSGEQKTEAR